MYLQLGKFAISIVEILVIIIRHERIITLPISCGRESNLPFFYVNCDGWSLAHEIRKIPIKKSSESHLYSNFLSYNGYITISQWLPLLDFNEHHINKGAKALCC